MEIFIEKFVVAAKVAVEIITYLPEYSMVAGEPEKTENNDNRKQDGANPDAWNKLFAGDAANDYADDNADECPDSKYQDSIGKWGFGYFFADISELVDARIGNISNHVARGIARIGEGGLFFRHIPECFRIAIRAFCSKKALIELVTFPTLNRIYLPFS